MIRVGSWMCVLGVLLASTGCGDDDDGSGSDAGVRDAAIESDASAPDASAPDAATSDAGSDAGTDGGARCGEVFCEADEACLREVCVATCGADVSALDAALGEGLVPVQSFCVEPVGPYAVHVAEGASPEIFDVGASTTGAVTTFTLRHWTLDPAVHTPTPMALDTATYTAPSETTMVYAGGYLAISPAGTAAVFGYTTAGGTFAGGVFRLASGMPDAVAVDGPGNFDAVWLDDDHFAVNGLGLDGVAEGQGLYVHDVRDGSTERAVTGLGEYSGLVAHLDATTLLVGGYATSGAPWSDGMSSSRVFAVSRADVLAATTAAPIDADGTASIAHTDALGTMRVLPGRGVAVARRNASFEIEAIELRTIAVEGTSFVLGEPTTIATPPLGDPRAVGDRILFQHEHGYLLVE